MIDKMSASAADGRSAIDGPVPMFKVGSSTSGAGKGLVADVATIIATSNEISKMVHTANEEETRKRVLALAISAPAVVMVDNVGSCGSGTEATTTSSDCARSLARGSQRSANVR